MKLYARNADKSLRGYLKADQIYYSDNLVLPKTLMINKRIMQFVYPSRQGVDKIANFFGVKKMSDLKLEIDRQSMKESHLNNDFEPLFESMKPYVLYHRLDTIDIADKKKQASYIKNLKITLVDACSCSIDGDTASYSLSEFEYVNMEDDFYLMVPDYVEDLPTLCRKARFCSSIAEIIGMVFNLAKDEDYVNMVHDFDFYKESLCRNDYYENRINECYRLLSIPNKLGFWNKVLEWQNKERVSPQSSSEELHAAIESLGIDIDDLKNIDYDLWNTEDSILLLRRIKDRFNDEKIFEFVDLSHYHEEKIEQQKNLLMQGFEYYLWDDLRNKSQEEQKKYIGHIYGFKGLNGFNTPDWSHKLDINYEQLLKDWISGTWGIEIKNRTEEIKCLYEDLEDELKQFDDPTRSLAFFENNGALLKEKIEERNNNKSSIQDIPDQSSRNTTAIEPTIIDHSNIYPTKNEKQNKQRSGRNTIEPYINYDSKADSKKAEKAKKAEALVYRYLRQNPSIYKNVKWMSSSGKLTAIQGDSAGYDFSYIDPDGVENYLEVKCSSNQSFFLSANEWNVARQHVDNYHIAIVNGTNITIIKSFFKDNSRYSEAVDTYMISFGIKP